MGLPTLRALLGLHYRRTMTALNGVDVADLKDYIEGFVRIIPKPTRRHRSWRSGKARVERPWRLDSRKRPHLGDNDEFESVR
jgi:hypothetical protein